VLEEVRRFAADPATHEWMKWRYTTHLFASLADLALARDDPERAAGYAEECLKTATPTLSRRYMIRGWRAKGRSALARSRWDEAEGALGQALAIAESIGERRQIWMTRVALAELGEARGDADRAQRHAQAARAVLTGMRAGLRDPRLRASFDAVPSIRSLLESPSTRP
jgi:tetratricopeptide (TPR) repeat protein